MTKSSCRFIEILGLLLIVGCCTRAIHPFPPTSSANPQWKSEPDFSAFIKTKFAYFENRGVFAFDNLASVVVLPTMENPTENIWQLEPGRTITIGALYLPSGSPRLDLPPGEYAVAVSREKQSWTAKFIDKTGQVIKTSPATVTRSAGVKTPVAHADHSICYEFDNTIICV